MRRKEYQRVMTFRLHPQRTRWPLPVKQAGQPNEALERAFGAMLKKKGMMSSSLLFWKSPPHFSLNFLKPDFVAPGSTMTVVCH